MVFRPCLYCQSDGRIDFSALGHIKMHHRRCDTRVRKRNIPAIVNHQGSESARCGTLLQSQANNGNENGSNMSTQSSSRYFPSPVTHPHSRRRPRPLRLLHRPRRRLLRRLCTPGHYPIVPYSLPRVLQLLHDTALPPTAASRTLACGLTGNASAGATLAAAVPVLSEDRNGMLEVFFFGEA